MSDRRPVRDRVDAIRRKAANLEARDLCDSADLVEFLVTVASDAGLPNDGRLRKLVNELANESPLIR